MINRKIVFAVTNDLTYDRRMSRICTALAGEGAQVTLIGRKTRKSKLYHPTSFKGIRFRCWFNKGPLFYAEFNIRLFFILLKHDFDIACACDLDTVPAIRLASRLKNIKSVYDAHEYFSEVPELNNRPLVKAIWNLISKQTIPAFDACYTVGQELASIMGKKFGVRFDVIRNIAPVKRNVTAVPVGESRKKVLLYQGALNVGRGLEACIEAMVGLPDWQFWLAGEGDITNHLKALAAEHGVGDRVDFLGWVQPENLPQLLSQAKLNINLREQGSLNDFYSLPNKFFDAIHAGLPGINMNYPEYASICSAYPCAYLLDEVKADRISDAVVFLDSHPDVYHSMQEACMAASKVFNWETESKKLIAIYSGL